MIREFTRDGLLAAIKKAKANRVEAEAEYLTCQSSVEHYEAKMQSCHSSEMGRIEYLLNERRGSIREHARKVEEWRSNVERLEGILNDGDE